MLVAIYLGPLYRYGVTWIPLWISNYINSMVWDDITYQFPNSNGCTVELWGLITNFILHFTGCQYLCRDSSKTMLINGSIGQNTSTSTQYNIYSYIILTGYVIIYAGIKVNWAGRQVHDTIYHTQLYTILSNNVICITFYFEDCF